MDTNLVQLTPNPAAQPQAEPVKPSGPKALLISLIALEVLTLAVAGYFGYQYSRLNRQPTTPLPTVQPTPIVTSTTTPLPTPVSSSDSVITPTPLAETSNFKTYTSSNQNYVPSSFFQKFPNFKNDIPSKLTFDYPKTWEVFKIDSTPYNKTILMFSLHKNDPRFSNCRSNGPCENYADIQFRIGMTDSTIKDFDSEFWGQAYPIAKTNNTTVNGVQVVQVFNTNTSPFPAGSLYKIAPDAQVNVTSEFFNFNDQNNEAEYSKQTIQEINQILSSLKFL